MSCGPKLVILLSLALCGLLTACNPRIMSKGKPENTTCNSCHDSKGNAALPGSMSAKAAKQTGEPNAHLAHIKGHSMGLVVGCDNCHVVPATVEQEGHIRGEPARVNFSKLATIGNVGPRWDRNSRTCSNTYCHGATLSGGANKDPNWATTDGSPLTCGSCHGNPPPPPHTKSAKCQRCHPGTVNEDGTINIAGGKHMNGVVDVESKHAINRDWMVKGSAGFHGAAALRDLSLCMPCHGTDLQGGKSEVSCDSCHVGGAGWKTNCNYCHGGDTLSVGGAPPFDLSRRTQTTEVTVGAHYSHLSGNHGLHAVLKCVDCHVTPTDIFSPGHIGQLPAKVVFGDAAKTGALTPAWNRVTATCSNTYCHGTTLKGGKTKAPNWTIVDGSQSTCESCHGNPPPVPHVQLVGVLDCGACHTTTVSGASTIKPGGTHMDGIKQSGKYHPENWMDNHPAKAKGDVPSCTACHGTALNGGGAQVGCDSCHDAEQIQSWSHPTPREVSSVLAEPRFNYWNRRRIEYRGTFRGW